MEHILSTKTTEGFLPLVTACYNGDLAVVKYIVEKCPSTLETPAGIKSSRKQGSPLYAAIEGRHLAIVQLLIQKGMDVNQEENGSPLKHAITRGHLDIVKALVSSNADIEGSDAQGYTCLMEASKLGHLQILQYLLDQGANVNVREKQRTGRMISI